jgi:hypothetical protein
MAKKVATAPLESGYRPNGTKRSKMVHFRVGRRIAPDEPGEQRDGNADQRRADEEIREARTLDDEAISMVNAGLEGFVRAAALAIPA